MVVPLLRETAALARSALLARPWQRVPAAYLSNSNFCRAQLGERNTYLVGMRLSWTLLLPALAHAFLPVPFGALPRASRVWSVMDATGADELEFPEDAFQQVFKAEFIHVRKSLNTLLKFWLMGKPDGAKGWVGTGELEAKHASSLKSAAVGCDSGVPLLNERLVLCGLEGPARSRRSCGISDPDH